MFYECLKAPLLISTVWFRAGLPNKRTPLASIELSWQRKKESHPAARTCWKSLCLRLMAVSYLLQHTKWVMVLESRICRLQSVWNAPHKQICFAIFLFFFYSVWIHTANKTFTATKCKDIKYEVFLVRAFNWVFNKMLDEVVL